MKTFLTPALLAGFAAALVLTLVQFFTTTPLILQVETYDQETVEQEAVSVQSVAQHGHDHDHSHDHADEGQPKLQAEEHHHDPDAWSPEDGWQRTLSTASANLLMGAGYALLLVGLYHFRAPTSAMAGLAWGAAGFVSLFAAPALGLHPELPGTASADLLDRQTWWLGTVLATAAGIGLCVFSRVWVLKGFGMALLVMPHVVGAPQPVVHAALAPVELQHQFFLASAIANAVFWLLLGWISSVLFRHFAETTTANVPGTPVADV